MYIKYLEIPHLWGLKEGDTLLLSSDVSRLSVSCYLNDEVFDANKFLDEIYSVIGESGTLLLPTYNWDFCHDVTFDYHKTPCKTGALGKVALKRKDFIRTHHPIYSFAVKGKYQELLYNMDNKESFGADSPFSFLELIKAKSVIIDVSLTNSYTYVHYNENRAGINSYRYQKDFTADYCDENGKKTTRTYSMLVRHLIDYYMLDLNPLEEEFLKKGVEKIVEINSIPYRIIDIFKTTPIIMDDIRNNQSRKICKHKWQ